MRLEYVISGVMPFLEDKFLVLANNGDLDEYKNVNVLPIESKSYKVFPLLTRIGQGTDC